MSRSSKCTHEPAIRYCHNHRPTHGTARKRYRKVIVTRHKELVKPLSFRLSDLFNFVLTSGKVPLIWKEANVTPIFKKDDPSVVFNYRPISLLKTVGKVLEKIVHKHLFNFIRDNNILTTLQSGLVTGDSTGNQLVDIYNTFCHSLDQGKEARTVFCDISKAFDRVWHRGLLYKLESAGISGSLLSWFKDYLNDRNRELYLKVRLLLGYLLRPAYLNDLFKALSFFSYILMIL